MALTRAELVRPHTAEGEPDAQQLLCAGMGTTPATWLRPDLAARTRFFDEQVLTAISAGIGQIVILGAGYDDRALRFRSPGVHFYEIDHPVTQADKVRRVRTMRTNAEGLVLAPCDFRRDDIDAVLTACGHDAGSPSLFICEGLFVYLDYPTIAGLLEALHTRGAVRSTLAASLATHPKGMDPDRLTAVANARRQAGRSEPWLTILPADAHLGMLVEAGWNVQRTIDAAQLDIGVVPGRSLLVTAHS